MSEFDELESKIKNNEQFNLLVSKTLITPFKFQRWYEVEICGSDTHYEVITIKLAKCHCQTVFIPQVIQ